MPKCVYCGTVYDIPRGLTLIMNDGRIQYLCSSKCRKNMLMKRRKVRWVTKSDENKMDMSARKNKESAKVNVKEEEKE